RSREFFGVKEKQSSRSRKTKKISQIPDWFAAWKKRNRPAQLRKQWSTEEPEAILDYLYGDVVDGELQAARYYEYARQSETVRQARREYARALRRLRPKRQKKRRLGLADVEQASYNVL